MVISMTEKRYFGDSDDTSAPIDESLKLFRYEIFREVQRFLLSNLIDARFEPTSNIFLNNLLAIYLGPIISNWSFNYSRT